MFCWSLCAVRRHRHWYTHLRYTDTENNNSNTHESADNRHECCVWSLSRFFVRVPLIGPLPSIWLAKQIPFHCPVESCVFNFSITRDVRTSHSSATNISLHTYETWLMEFRFKFLFFANSNRKLRICRVSRVINFPLNSCYFSQLVVVWFRSCVCVSIENTFKLIGF